MIITIDDLSKSGLYPEIIEEITRADDTVAEMQILAAEDMAKSYLSKYDITKIFGDDDTDPAYSSPLLNRIISTIATYFLLLKGSPNIDIEQAQENYDQAITLLENIRDGKNNLFGAPVVSDDPDTEEDESNAEIYADSNIKRTNHF